MQLPNLLSRSLSATEFIILFAVFLLSYYWFRRPKRFPPGPRGVPFLGVLPFAGSTPERYLARLSEKYGSVVSARMGGTDWVVLNDYDSIQEALVKKKEAMSGRPVIPISDQIREGHGIIFLQYDSLWKSQRKFGLSTLRGFGVGQKSMEARIQEEIRYMCEEIEEHSGKPYDMQKLLANAVSNIICGITFGQRFDYNDKRFDNVIRFFANQHFLDTLDFNLTSPREFKFSNPKNAIIVRILMLAPNLIYYPPFSFINKRMVASSKFLRDFMQSIIAEHKETYNDENHRDFIDAYISKMDGNNEFTDKQLFHFIRDLFIAGTETTTSTLRWAILVLLHYPTVAQALHKEIVQVVGTGASPAKMANKADMPYTSAFIEELYRFSTLLPLNVPHSNHTHDVTLNGYVIPKNTLVACNLWAVHNNPTVFPEPQVFRPERHLDSAGKFVKSTHVIPFSVGPRHCLGEQLARMEVFLFLVGIVQNFKFRAVAGELPCITRGAGGPANVPLPYEVIAEQR